MNQVKLFIAALFIICLGTVTAQLPSLLPISLQELAKTTIKSTDDSPEESNTDVPRFYLYGSATINTTEGLAESLTGSQKFAARYVLRPHVTGSEKDNTNSKVGINATISINTLNLRPTGVSIDSIDFISFMFPETGNAGFIFGPEVTYFQQTNSNHQHSFSGEASFALRQNKVNNVGIYDSAGVLTGSETIDFSLINLNVTPIKYTFQYQKDDLLTWLSLSAYYHYFNVPNEDATNFNKIFDEQVFDDLNGKNSRINAIGGKISGGVNGFEFYADMRNNFTPNTLSDKNPYKGFVFNAGFATSLVVFKR